MVQSFDKQFGAPSATSTKTKFANRGWFRKMEASSANNLLKQEIVHLRPHAGGQQFGARRGDAGEVTIK